MNHNMKYRCETFDGKARHFRTKELAVAWAKEYLDDWKQDGDHFGRWNADYDLSGVGVYNSTFDLTDAQAFIKPNPGAHFWTWVNRDWVHINLKPGQIISHVEGGPTEEGYDWTETAWEHCGDRIERSWRRDARDCDGRMTWGGVQECALSKLADVAVGQDNGDDVLRPGWDDVERSQRDYAAEAMGY